MPLKGCTCNDATCGICRRAQVRAEKQTNRLRAATQRQIAEYNRSMDEINEECADCGSTGHNTGSNTCPGPDVQDKLEDPNRATV